MPEPCYPRNAIPVVDWRAWIEANGGEDPSPRSRGGYFAMVAAAIIQRRHGLA